MSTSSSSSSVSTTPLYFTGVSKYSDDLQTILTRAVSIATVPLTQIQNQETDLISRKQLLTDLNTSVAALADTVTSLGSIGDNQGVSASSSDSNRVSVSLNGTATPGFHTITDITSVARAASETSTSGYATADQTAVATGDSLELAIGSKTYSVDTSGSNNNLNTIASEINKLNVGVSATVLNTGTGGTPYYLSLTASASGATTLELRNTAGDSGSTILTKTNQGADANFYLDGLPVEKSDNVVNDVIPGVSFTIVSQTDGDSVTLSLSSQRGDLANALNSLVTNYNALATKVNAQIGPNAGLLSGDFIVRQVQNQLRALTGTVGTGSVQSLADLGIELDKTGTMTFNSDTLYSMSNADLASAFTFLNSSTGLGSLAANLTGLSDPTTGLIKIQQDQYDVTDKRLTDQATALNQRISDMQTTLLARLQAADALLASLASQQDMLTASITSLNYTAYGSQTTQTSTSTSY